MTTMYVPQKVIIPKREGEHVFAAPKTQPQQFEVGDQVRITDAAKDIIIRFTWTADRKLRELWQMCCDRVGRVTNASYSDVEVKWDLPGHPNYPLTMLPENLEPVDVPPPKTLGQIAFEAHERSECEHYGRTGPGAECMWEELASEAHPLWQAAAEAAVRAWLEGVDEGELSKVICDAYYQWCNGTVRSRELPSWHHIARAVIAKLQATSAELRSESVLDKHQLAAAIKDAMGPQITEYQSGCIGWIQVAERVIEKLKGAK